MNWRDLAAEGRWREICWYHLDQSDLPELLSRLRAFVPTITDPDGVEEHTRYCLPHELPKELRKDEDAIAAALTLTELDTAVEGDPIDATTHWKRTRAFVLDTLRTALIEPNTEGTLRLSRHGHANDALDLIDQLDRLFVFYDEVVRREAPDRAAAEEQSTWISEVMGEVAALAFTLGQHAHAVWGKPMERLAETGRRVVDGGKRAAAVRKDQVQVRDNAAAREDAHAQSEGHDRRCGCQPAGARGQRHPRRECKTVAASSEKSEDMTSHCPH